MRFLPALLVNKKNEIKTFHDHDHEHGMSS